MRSLKFGISFICGLAAGFLCCLVVHFGGQPFSARTNSEDRTRPKLVKAVSPPLLLPNGPIANPPVVADPYAAASAESLKKLRTMMADSKASAAMAAYLANKQLDKYFLVFHRLNLTREQVTKATDIM